MLQNAPGIFFDHPPRHRIDRGFPYRAFEPLRGYCANALAAENPHLAMLRAKGVVLEPEENKNQQASVFGKRFANGGGVTAAVLECLKETNENADIKVVKCNGAAECKKALLLLKMGRLPEDFVEGMACVGGCVGGPSSHKSEMEAKKSRDKLIAEADARQVHENLKQYKMDSFSMHRH